MNITALPDSILESELFGHEQGAFTGAMGRRIGKFEYANGGTLFLDEVGEMPLDTQVKLLRVLEERKITRLGANEEMDVNVRLVAATNANLKELVAEKNSAKICTTASVSSRSIFLLARTPGRYPLLLDHFQKELSERSGKEVQGFSKAARQALTRYEWPGNIRQLRNSVERMIILDTDGLLDIDDLPHDIAELVDYSSTGEKGDGFLSGADSLVGRPLAEVEKYYIQKALELTGGKREEAASMLGIGERTLYRKIREYELKKN
ncbi:MAG: sigma 54-interacting transcriptional regulator [Planctomycetaceae bacterium]